jgi:hypothetical protein
MPRRIKTPQEKKKLSLTKDRRNTYGENAKSSRKNIARNKVLSHQKVRAKAREGLSMVTSASEADADTLQSTLTTPRLQKSSWRKCPDTPLGEVVKSKLVRRKRDVGAKQRRRAKRLAI